MEYKITKEQILAMAKECPIAEKILKAGFPDAFDGEWVEVPLSSCFIDTHEPPTLSVGRGVGPFHAPFLLTPNENSQYHGMYKLENHKIWRRK